MGRLEINSDYKNRTWQTGGRLKKEKQVYEKKTSDFFEGLFIALIAALIIRQFVVQAYRIPTPSMEKTLLVGDFLLVDKYSYGMRTPDWIGIPYTDFGVSIPWVRIPGFREPKQDDVVIFRYPLDQSMDYIKRCIAAEGQTLEIVDKKVFVDGVHFPDPPASQFIDRNIYPRDSRSPRAGMTLDNGRYGSRDNFGPLKVPEKNYFMMGDNRDNSADSRYWGYVNFDHIVGRALIIYLSWGGDEDFSLYNLFSNIRYERIANVIR